MKPSLPRSLDLSSPALFSDRLGERHVETALKTSPLFPLSVCLSVPPLLARSPDRSLLINPFGGRCHCCRCPLHRTGFFSIDHFLCVCKMGANIKRKRLTRSLFDPLSLSFFLSLSLSLPPQIPSDGSLIADALSLSGGPIGFRCRCLPPSQPNERSLSWHPELPTGWVGA